MRFVYAEFKDYVSDVESLVSRENSLNYIEGFAIVNTDDPVSGYNSVSFSPDQRFDPGRIPPGAGPVLYCLELVLHYNHQHTDSAANQSNLSSTVDEVNIVSSLGYHCHFLGTDVLL